jgi:hypothetical protein
MDSNIPPGLYFSIDEANAKDKEISDLRNRLQPYVLLEDEAKELGFKSLEDLVEHMISNRKNQD